MPNKKKFVIKPFKPNAQMDKNAAQKVWNALRSAIGEIHNKNASSLSFEELYRNAYNLVLHKHGDLLYEGVRETVLAHLKKAAAGAIKSPNECLLKKLGEVWRDHVYTMTMIRDILMYMDRTYVMQHKLVPVYDCGLIIFRDTIIRNVEVKERLLRILLHNIKRERCGEVIDRALVKGTLSMLMDLGAKTREVYENDFEQHFLRETKLFYTREAQDFLAENTCPDYLRKAQQRLQEESKRVSHYLDASTQPRLRQIMVHTLVERHASALVNMDMSGCVSMFKYNKIDDLKRMYDLFSRVPSTLRYIRECMHAYVKEVGSNLVKDPICNKEPVLFIQKLLDMRDQYDAVVAKAFRGDTQFSMGLKEAFESFLNEDPRPARYLSRYIDHLLKKKLAGLADGSIEGQLDRVIVIFRYLQDKDVFENYYKQHLAKRLLDGRSQSDDAERTMITKLKTECGYQYTSKLEGMFKDVRLSKETNEAYKLWASGRRHDDSVDLMVHVLTTGFWPSVAAAQKCRLPPQIDRCCEMFKSFYLQKYTGRRLQWQKGMGTGTVTCLVGDKRKELNVSTYQMCILLLFNQIDELTLVQIREKTGIPGEELKRHLVSLCFKHCRILCHVRSNSTKRAILDTDKFRFNGKFKSKFFRVKVPLVSSRKAQRRVNHHAVPAPVEEDRRHLVEAAIVRIMKSRLSLDHNTLIAEVTRQLSSRFRPTPQQIKKRIESLMEREYIERSPDNRKIYRYLA